MSQTPTRSRTTQYVVPAQPGFTALEPVFDATGSRLEFYRHHVIAWRVEITWVPGTGEHIHTAIPVTVQYPCDPDMPIKYPDGRIVVSGGATFDDEAAALAYLLEPNG